MKRSLAFAAFFAALLLAAYCGAWLYSAQWFEKEVERLYADASHDGAAPPYGEGFYGEVPYGEAPYGEVPYREAPYAETPYSGAPLDGRHDRTVRFLGPKPVLKNFPFVPELHYHGGIKTGDAEILFPQMILRGYPVPGLSLKAIFPLGIMLGGIADPALWKLDYLESSIAVPYRLPRDFTQGAIADWKARGGKIDVRHYEIRLGALTADGHGLLTVDDQLQPVFNLESRLTGYNEFIDAQIGAGQIKPLPAAIARGVFASLARPDGETGESAVHIAISAENRLLRVGPVLVLELPLFVWGTHRPPALHL
ncbi:MAG: DUF2125 domain-containing protein [Micavibrio sp.]